MIKHDGRLKTRGKCRKHEPQASVFYISRVFSNVRREQGPIYIILLYIELAISILIGRKRTVNFRNQRLWRHNCRLYNNHVKVTSNHVKVTGNHVVYDRGAWFLSVTMSSSRALAKKQKNDFNLFSVQCTLNQLLDSVFVISRIIEVSVRVMFQRTLDK